MASDAPNPEEVEMPVMPVMPLASSSSHWIVAGRHPSPCSTPSICPARSPITTQEAMVFPVWCATIRKSARIDSSKLQLPLTCCLM
jgi:hypothetical protein